MKPLSTVTYFKNNLKKMLPGFVCMALGVFIIYFFSIIVHSSVIEINRGSLNMFKRVTSVCSNTKDPIPDRILNEIRGCSNVEYIIPIISDIGSFRYKSPLGNINTCGLNVFEEDIPKLLKIFDIKLVKGKLPSSNSNEVLIPLKIAKQNKIKVGDYLSKDDDSNVILNRKYKVCGIIDGNVDAMITTNTGQIKKDEAINKSLIFSLKDEDNKMINDEIIASGKNKVTIIDYKSAYGELNEILKVVDSVKYALNFIVITVLCISLSNLNHILFSNRKGEIAILSAIGYKKTTIYKKLLKENIALNLLAFIFGIAFTIVVVELLNIVIFKPNGQYVYSFHMSSIFNTFLIPLFVSISNMISPLRSLKAMNYECLNI